MDNIEKKEKCMPYVSAIPCSEIQEKELLLRPEEEVILKRICNLLNINNLKRVVDQLTAEGYPTGISVLFYDYFFADIYNAALQVAKQSGLNVIEARTSTIQIDSVKEIKDSVHSFFETYEANLKHGRSVLMIVNDVDSPSILRGSDNVYKRIGLSLKYEISKFTGVLFLISEKKESIPSELFNSVLYKVRFSKPDPSILEKKWLRFSDGMLADYASYLSRSFSLDTIQMQNVCKLVKIDFIIDGVLPSKERVAMYCISEMYDKYTNTMGFSNNNT